MTTLENFYFGNTNLSDYEVKTDVKKQLNLITKLTGELNETLSTEELLIPFTTNYFLFETCQKMSC